MIIVKEYVEQFIQTIKKGDFKQYIDNKCELTKEYGKNW